MPADPNADRRPSSVQGDNAEREPDPARPSGDTPEHREDAEALEEHRTETTAPTDPG